MPQISTIKALLANAIFRLITTSSHREGAKGRHFLILLTAKMLPLFLLLYIFSALSYNTMISFQTYCRDDFSPRRFILDDMYS